MACGTNYVISHAEPNAAYTRQQLIDARYDENVVSGLIWTKNDQVKENTAEKIINNLQNSFNSNKTPFGVQG